MRGLSKLKFHYLSKKYKLLIKLTLGEFYQIERLDSLHTNEEWLDKL